MKRANIVKEVRIIHVVASALLFLGGILLLVWPKIGNTAVQVLVGVNFIVTGAARILGYFANDLYRLAFQYDLAMGSFCAIFGVLLIIYPNNFLVVLPLAIGVYAMLDGLLKLQTAFDAKAFGMQQWWGLLTAASIVAVIGVVLLIISALETTENVITLTGVTLMLDGAENVWNTMGTVRVRAKEKNRFEEELDGSK